MTSLKNESNREHVGESVPRGVAFLFLSRIVMLLCGLSLQVVLARLLGVEQYGLYGLILSILVWFELFMMGIGRASSMQVAKSPSEAYAFYPKALKVQSIVGLTIMAFSMSVALFLPHLFNRPGAISYFLLAFIDIPLMGYFYLFQGMLNGLQFYKYQANNMSLYYVSRLLISVLLVKMGLSLTGAIVANLVSSLIGILLASRIFIISVDKTRRAATITVRGLLRSTVPFIALPIIFNILAFVNLWIVGAMASEMELGIYNAAFSLSRIMLVLFDSVTTALFPAIVVAISAVEFSKASRLFHQSSRFLLLIIAPSCLFLVFSARTILEIFGGQYSAGSDLLILLVCGFSLLSFLTLFNYVHMASNRFWKVITINIFAAVLEVPLSILLVRRVGPAGAAASLVIASLVACALQLALMFRKFGLPISLESFLKIVASAGICGAILFPIRELWLLIPAYLICFSLYIAIIIFLGEFKPGEIRYWVQLLRKR